MFVNESALKKQIKKAYKAGQLTVARNGEMLYIASCSWAISIDKEAVPNKTKAALIELIGELPVNGEAFTYSAEGAQSVMPETLRELDLDTYYDTAGQTYEATRVFVQNSATAVGIYIQGDDLSHYIASKEVFDMYSPESVDMSLGEEMPEKAKMNGPFLVWGNNVMAMEILAIPSPRWSGEKAFLRSVDGIDLNWMFTEE
ncbi:MAG: hypothetical protein K5675_04870 [Lachnospiraceae bacterium]|nr:hypothetical protein [Lachnospiraceae bacterium]